MMETGTLLPARRSDLMFTSRGNGDNIVKDRRAGSYFSLGDHEAFLLSQLDGTQTLQSLCDAFEEHFGAPVDPADVEQFIEMSRQSGLLEAGETGKPVHRPALDPVSTPASAAASSPGRPAPRARTWPRGRHAPEPAESRHADDPAEQFAGEDADASVSPSPSPPPSPNAAMRMPRGSVLFWRISLFNPDRMMSALAPQLRFLWTRAFFLISTACIVAAACVVWENRISLVGSFTHTLEWQTLALAWGILVITTLLHEFSHGLTLKHYGGEVTEIGFLCMFFIPCFYCNVSDAWLLKDRRQRLWVSMAGGWCDLCLWALAVFAWRLTQPDSVLNYAAWVMLSICGARVFFNFNPLMKYDGYYMLSDWMEIPNLRRQAGDRFMAHLRRLLWGAPAPQEHPRGRFLFWFGFTTWLYGLLFLTLMLLGLFQWLGSQWGLGGVALVMIVACTILRNFFRGLNAGEFTRMILTRKERALAWSLALAACIAAMVFACIPDRVGGSFQVRPAVRAEVRADASGFLREVCVTEGQRVQPGQLIARLEAPELDSRIAQKQAEILEAQAKLRQLEVGPRPEEIAEQRRRIQRAEAWLGQAKLDLAHARESLKNELAQLDSLILQYKTDVDYARDMLSRAEDAARAGVVSVQEQADLHRKVTVAELQLQQARSQREARAATGTMVADGEVVRRERELADLQGVLLLLEAGSRQEEIQGQRARLQMLEEEARNLRDIQGRLIIRSRAEGIVATAHPADKLGQNLKDGDLVCLIEPVGAFEAEINVAEQDAADVKPGERVRLKPRSLPFETYIASVERVAPSAVTTETQSNVIVYCRSAEAGQELRPGMTGYAHIYCSEQPIIRLLARRAMRFLRTEMW